MVLINTLVAGLLLGPGVLSAAVPQYNSARTVRRQVAAPSTLKPIRLSQLDSVLSGRPVKRDTDSAGFALTDKEKLIYGLAGADSLVLANVTLLSTDGKPLINMESFEDSTKSVECGEQMKLEFVSKEAFDSAVASWGWVNEDETHEFIMIANHRGCSPEDERTPYQVFNADYDEQTFTATLDAKRAVWKDIANTFNVDFGKVLLPTSFSKRDFFPDITFDDSVSIDLTHTISNPVIFTTSIGASGFDLTVSCLDCGTKGTLDVSGHIVVSGFSVEELSVEASPENFEARLEVGVKVNGKANGLASFSTKLFSVSLGGISIPGIFTLGPTLDYEVGFSTSLEGTAQMSYGVLAKINNNAIIKADLINSKNTQFQGWEPTFEQIPFKLNAQAKATVTAFSKPVLALTFDVIGLPAYEAAFEMKLPQVTATLSPIASSAGGVCGVTAKSTGVQVSTDIAVDLTFRVGEDSGTALFERQLFAVNKHLVDTCIALF